MQVALVVTADEFPILGEGHVTLEDAGAHARASLVTLFGVLGKLQGPTPAVTDRERSLFEGPVTTLEQSLLEWAGSHFIHQVERARPQLHAMGIAVVVILLSLWT